MILYSYRKKHTKQKGHHNEKNEIIDIKIDRDGNRWETKIMTNFAGEKYKVLYKNGKKIDNLGRIW